MPNSKIRKEEQAKEVLSSGQIDSCAAFQMYITHGVSVSLPGNLINSRAKKEEQK